MHITVNVTSWLNWQHLFSSLVVHKIMACLKIDGILKLVKDGMYLRNMYHTYPLLGEFLTYIDCTHYLLPTPTRVELGSENI